MAIGDFKTAVLSVGFTLSNTYCCGLLGKVRSYKLRTAREYVSPEERKTYLENGTLPSGILTYSYNAGGLVTQVKKNNVPLVKFFYNDRNQRLKKETYGGTNGDKILSTHYVRDVGGQVMAIYNEPQNGTPKVAEYPV